MIICGDTNMKKLMLLLLLPLMLLSGCTNDFNSSFRYENVGYDLNSDNGELYVFTYNINDDYEITIDKEWNIDLGDYTIAYRYKVDNVSNVFIKKNTKYLLLIYSKEWHY